ncbi:MAG: hypothetical protein FWC40_01180 [Proteobacteria bacterium]|nr:hypothetical protein [Pseudomonadota bacterium]
MTISDPSLLSAKIAYSLQHDKEAQFFSTLAGRIFRTRVHRDEIAHLELIVTAQVFAHCSQAAWFVPRLRALYAEETGDARLTALTRTSLTDYPPARHGLPHADDQNAQSVITQPLGIQKARARQNHRGDNEALLRSPFVPVIEILCQNPAIRQSDILFMASRRPTTNALLVPILLSAWTARQEVRFALTANPYLNTSHALRCALTLGREHLQTLSNMAELHPCMKSHAALLLAMDGD